MVDIRAIEISKKIYDEARTYFCQLDLTDCVIEISDKPMSQWSIHFTNSDHQIFLKRVELGEAKIPHIAIYKLDEGTFFFFSDYTILSLELLDTKSFIFSHIEDERNEDLELVKSEFRALKKMLQCS